MISHHETRLGRHITVMRGVAEERSVGESRVICPACQEDVRFESEHLTGYALQRCKCGVSRVPRYAPAVDAKVFKRKQHQICVTCRVCDREFMTREERPTEFCGMKCRHTQRRRDVRNGLEGAA